LIVSEGLRQARKDGFYDNPILGNFSISSLFEKGKGLKCEEDLNTIKFTRLSSDKEKDFSLIYN
jgi:hypothetical protein